MKKTFLLLIICNALHAQKIDTIYVSNENISLDKLKFGKHKYLVYAKDMVKDSLAYLTVFNRNITKIEQNNRTIISIKQKWQGQEETVLTSLSHVEASSFYPISQTSWNIRTDTISVDFNKGSFKLSEKAKKTLADAHQKGMIDAFNKAIKERVYNWHLDLELFSLINYRKNKVYGIKFYDPGSYAPKVQFYTNQGIKTLASVDGTKVKCWLLTKKTNGKITEKIWISKRSNLVLKVEQNFGSIVRIKSRIL